MSIYTKLFERAKEKGIEACEIALYKKTSLSITLYKSEIESLQPSSASNFVFRAIYNGRFGQINMNVLNSSNIDYVIDKAIENAKVIEKEEKAILFKGSEKYHKISTFNKDFEKVTIEEKKEKLFALEKALYALDKRVNDVCDTTYAEEVSEFVIMNSYGLKLRQKSNSFYYLSEVICADGEEKKTGFDAFIGNDFSKFDVDDLAKKIVKDATEKFGGTPIESQKCKVVLSPRCVSSMTEYFIGHAIAEEVQKHSSLFEGKLGTKIASKKITISEKPLCKGINARWFDDEGVATYNKDIVKGGVLQTYLYNLETASKDGVTTTGNGYRAGGRIGTSTSTIELKKGKKSLDELIVLAGDGLYVTDFEGLNSGVSEESGNFSLKAEGFLIKNGKLDHPVSLITVAGNFVQLFKDVLEVGSESKVLLSGNVIPPLLIKSLSIAGK